MTSEARDLSDFGGTPIYLYQFSRTSTPTLTGVPVVTFWRYTSTDRDYTYGGYTWKATAISDDGIRQSGDAASDQMTMTMPATEAIPQMFTGTAPSDPILARIIQTHYGETDGFLAWAGRVASVVRAADDVTAKVMCQTNTATLDRAGIRLAWSRQCPHILYDSECRADPRNFYIEAVLTTVNAAVVAADEFRTVNNTPDPGDLPAGRLLGGFLEWIDADGNAERRGIIIHGDDGFLRVMGTVDDKRAVGDPVYAFFGCAHNEAACDGDFDNIDNYGGHVYMPDQNPFTGDNIF